MRRFLYQHSKGKSASSFEDHIIKCLVLFGVVSHRIMMTGTGSMNLNIFLRNGVFEWEFMLWKYQQKSLKPAKTYYHRVVFTLDHDQVNREYDLIFWRTWVLKYGFILWKYRRVSLKSVKTLPRGGTSQWCLFSKLRPGWRVSKFFCQ